MKLEIVGRRHYRASVKPGEKVSLKREPDNAYDANAIRVENSCSECVGYLSRAEAALFAPLIDADKVRVEGDVPSASAETRGTDFEGHRCPVIVSVFLREEGGDDIPEPEEEMDDDGDCGAWPPFELN